MLIYLAGALLLDLLKERFYDNQVGGGAGAIALALGAPMNGGPWAVGLLIVVRALLADPRKTSRGQYLSQTGQAVPFLTAVLIASRVPNPLQGLVASVLAYAVLNAALYRRQGIERAWRYPCEELLWAGVLIFSIQQGAWWAMFATIIFLLTFTGSNRAAPDELQRSFSEQLSVAERTVLKNKRQRLQEREHFRVVVNRQQVLDEFQGQALRSASIEDLGRSLIQAIGKISGETSAALEARDGQRRRTLCASEGFMSHLFEPVPPLPERGAFLWSQDRKRLVYALDTHLLFLAHTRQATSTFPDVEFLEHLLARSQLIAQILEQNQELSSLVQQKTQALGRLAESQAQLVQSGKLAAVGQLAAGVAHEINSPLAAISLQVQLARKRLNKDDLDGAKKSLDTCEKASLRAKTIIEKLLRFSRISDGQKIPSSLQEVVAETSAMLNAHLVNTKVDLRLDLAELPQIEIAPQEIHQVLTNIVLNAVDALKERSSERQIVISTRAREDRQQIRVANNGPALDDSLKARMFEPFFTTKEIGSGTGLGLSVAHQIVEAHQGHLDAGNEDGWVVFTVTLPAVVSTKLKPHSMLGRAEGA